MKKLVVRFLMLLFVLGISTNVAWAGSDILEMAQQAKDNDLLTEEQIAALTEMPYRATLTGRTSSTGGGKVYVTTEGGDPTTEEYVEGVSNVATNGFPISMPGMDEMKVYIYAHAKPLDGYYFVGWSGSDGGTDLISDSVYDSDLEKMVMPTKQYIKRYDVATQPNDTAYYVIYGTFDPIRIADYAISGDYTTKDGTGKKYSDFQVVFTLYGTAEDIDASDFKDPSVSGTGWSIDNWDYNTNTGKVTVNVHFETTNTDPAEYSAQLTLETKADISMKVDLHTRTAASSYIEAVRYNKNKAKVGEGDLTVMIAAAAPTDVIKLNKNYEGQVVATKSFTLDLNGYNITHNYSDIVANYSTTDGQTNPTRIAQAAILVNNADAVVTLAYSPYGGKIIAGPYNDAIDVLAGKLVLNGGTLVGFFGVGSMGEVVQNGATIVGGSGCAVASMGGMFTMTDGKIYGELGTMGETSELVINGGSIDATSQTIEGVTLPSDYPGVQVGGGSAWIKKGTIKGGSYGVQNVGGSITIEKLAVITGGSYALDFNSGLTTINCGKFEDPTTLCNLSTIESKILDGNAALVSCYLKTNSPGASSYWDIPVWRNTSGAEFREGYEFFVGPSDAAKAAGVSVCHIGGTSYSSLEDALAYANTTSDSIAIVMDNDYILPAGYYTLPGHATLIIPMNSEQGSACQLVTKVPGKANDYVQPFKYRKLTFSNGVNFDVHGLLEVGGSQFAGETRYTGSPIGSYGQLQMNKGSRMILQNGSELRAWGYITGDIANKNAQYDVPMGEIDARRGSLVHEQFQMGDWGSDILSAAMGLLTHAESTFPISDYFIQNIEVPVKYHPGARLSAATSVYADASAGNMQLRALMSADDIKIVGVNREDNAMFLLDANADAENTWVRKWYDASKDQQVYEINSGAHIGQLIIPLISSPLFKDAQDLMKQMGGTVGTIGSLLSGGGISFPEELTMNSGQYFLPITTNFKLHLLSGKMDFTQSTELLPGSELEIDKEATVTVTQNGIEGVREGSLYIYDIADWGEKESYLVKYSPAFEGEPTTRDANDLPSASVNVHGTFDTDRGYVFTTENGGNIYSSIEDAGTFTFTEAAKDADYYEEITQYGGQNARCYSAFLRNSDEWVNNGGSRYVNTGGTAEDVSYCYLDLDGQGGRWMALEQRGCFTYDDVSKTYFIKPQEYVAVTSNVADPTTHTYSDAAGKGRLFILIYDDVNYVCHWWEVEAKDNYFHCIHPENDTYYEWNGTKWVEKKFTITWKDWDGSTITTYSVPYGTQAEWLSSNPTREKNLDYTYDFTGWSPALGKVTSDVTYTATYEEKQIKYTVVFVQDGGVEIERHLLARDEVPVCENTPTRTGYILQWEPGIEPVVGNQTYVATWLPEPPATYTITFKNYDGTQLEQKSVTADATPVYTGSEFSKKATSEYEYAFTGWKPTLAPATTNATYVAQFSETAITYTINFYNEDEDEILKTENLAWGATPTPPAVSKTETGYTFTYVWKNTADASKSIESVKGAANYKPVFTGTANKYTVTLKSNLPGACTFTGAGIYDYNTSVSIAATPVSGYEFIKWQETGNTNASLGSQTITGDITLTAVVKETAKDDPQDMELGLNIEQTISSATDVMDLIITSDGTNASSQLTGAGNITLYGNADFILKKHMDARHWYDIAVPWRVEANGGIFIGNSTTPAVLGTDIEIFYYKGDVRAAQGPVDACWGAVKDLSKKMLEPGRAYLFILLSTSAEQVTFRKKVQEPILTTGTSVEQYNSMTGDDKDRGWNGIANPALFKAYLNAGASFAQKINSAGDGYETVDEDQLLVVGQPIYVQVPAAKSVVADGSSYSPSPVRRMLTKATPTRYEVTIASSGATKNADRVFVQINEEKEQNKYTIGQDLAKFGTGSTIAQMWINRYNSKLSVNTIAPEGETSDFPMSIYAPKAGEYTIAIEHAKETEDYILYLTYNGEAIWNLSESDYVAYLNKGTDANYGLRISVKKTPAIATGIDEAVVDAQGDIRKVLINDKVFIIRGDKVYTIDGQLVK